MIILRQKEYSFKERLTTIIGGAEIGAMSSLIFGIPAGIVAKISGGSFKKAVGFTMLAGAILGALCANGAYSADKYVKEWTEWINDPENRKKLKVIVKKNLPPSKILSNIKKFEIEANRLNEQVRNDGYDISAATEIEELITALGSKIFHIQTKTKVIPEDSPLPIMTISGVWDQAQVLWYSKDKGWLHDGKSISGPKEFILDCIENKFDMIDVEGEDWFLNYQKEFKELVQKYL